MNRTRRCCGAGRKWARRLGFAALSLLAAACCGCLPKGLFGGTRTAVHLGRGRLVVLPFATVQRSHFESDVGALFSQRIAELVREGCPSAKVLDAEDLPERIEGRELKRFSVAELGEALKADYLVIGEIHVLRGKEPKSYRVLMGTMVISARVIDLKEGKIAWQIDHRRFHYPPPIGTEVIPAQETDETVVIKKVMREAAWGVAEVFRGPRDPEEGKYIR